jgi:hypothetical protein
MPSRAPRSAAPEVRFLSMPVRCYGYQRIGASQIALRAGQTSDSSPINIILSPVKALTGCYLQGLSFQQMQ